MCLCSGVCRKFSKIRWPHKDDVTLTKSKKQNQVTSFGKTGWKHKPTHVRFHNHHPYVEKLTMPHLKKTLNYILPCDTGNQFSHLQRAHTFYHDWLEKKWLTWAMNACVGYKQSRIVFLFWFVDAVHWCVLIRLWECSVLWIIVFPSLPLSMVRASSSTLCYYWVIWLPSFPVAATTVNATTLCAHVHVHGWVDRWLWQHKEMQ